MVRSNFQDNIPPSVTEWIRESGGGDIEAIIPVVGGCINNGVRLSTKHGLTYFLKTNRNAPPDMFMREAEGLERLRGKGRPRVPLIHLSGPKFLLLEDLSPISYQENFWESLGNQLANLHQTYNSKFGLEEDNYIGSTRQINRWTEDGFDFFANNRLIYQAELARKQSLLSGSEEQLVEKLGKRLPEILPAQPSVLLHGDLWSGNVISGPNGEPAIIDPAVYFGWAEAELAITTLFGGFPAKFYEAYQEAAKLQPGWRDRFEIYNLYHLLNHLNIFGKSYHGSVMRILKKYA